MSLHSRREYLQRKRKKYLKIKGRKARGLMLNEIVETTGLARNYVVGLMKPGTDLTGAKLAGRKSRGKIYDNTAGYYLKKIWDILDCPCGQRLAPALPGTMDALHRHKEMNIPQTIKEKLLVISPSTCDRLLAKWKRSKRHRLHGSTKPGSLLKKQIPIVLSRWDEKELGFSEIDLVAHNGGNPQGEFGYTLVDTDLLSGWTEQEAILGKAQKRVKAALGKIDKRRSFGRKGIDSDSGSEFINWLLYKHCQKEEVIFTRGRPGKKNDNAHVEQKNWTHVRKLIGYHRYDTKRQVDLINDLYRNEWRLYENFFQPTIKLQEKKRVGGRMHKKYGIAKTPYQRIMESSEVPTTKKIELEEIYYSLNPAELKREIERKLKVIFQTTKQLKDKFKGRKNKKS